MRTTRKRNLLFILIISVTISALLALSSVLNIVSFRNTYVDATAASNAVVASGTVNKIEYTLKYGKSLENYYGMEEQFDELQSLYGYLDHAYVADADGSIMYETVFTEGTEPAAQLADMAATAIRTGETQIWLEGNEQHVLLPIHDRAGTPVALLGISYDVDMLDSIIAGYVDDALLYTVVAIAVGIALLVILFFVIRHGFAFRPLLMVVIAVVVVANMVFGSAAYTVFSNGYLALTSHTSDIFYQKIRADVESVVSQGVAYSELSNMEQYFADMASSTNELESISLVAAGDVTGGSDFVHEYPLMTDSRGESMHLRIEVSQSYVQGKINTILIEIAVSIITALMIAAEVIIFILAALTSKEKVGRLHSKAIIRESDKCYQPYGIVRGLVFFFSMFRFMAMAFVSLVIIEIYQPVVLFGMEIPYELMISLPLTAQMLSSMLGSFISGKISDRFGWKVAACGSILLMSVGCVLSAVSASPLPFVGSQLVFGLGLGVSKTAVDLFAVMVSSDDKMEEYTSNTNASGVVGMSCSSAIGAIIAGALGYANTYFLMALLGVLVVLLLLVFGQNMLAGKEEKKEEAAEQKPKKRGWFDIQFVAYILFLVLPYYFVIMFVDYLFPVFGNANGMSTSEIGYVLLAYGVMTSYVGTFLCRVLTKHVRTVVLMALIVMILAAGLGVFAMYNSVVLAVAMVLLISLCDGIMPSLQFKLVYNLPTTHKIGFSRALGIEGFFTGAISAVAPMVFSFVMMQGNTGFMIAAACVAACAVLFGAINRKVKEGDEENA